jgi:hydroxypyruvate reductase
VAQAPDRFGNRLLDASKSPAFRALALEVLAAGLAAVDPYQAVRRFLQRTGSLLRAGDSLIDLDQVGRVIVVGAGKAGGPMAAAVEEILGERIAVGWVNVKTGHLTPTRTIHLHEAGHPIPNEAGAHGSEQIARLLEGLRPDDLVLCLVSGGGSALLGLPYADIRLEEVQELTDSLLRAGASINELNTVRKHLDRLKGGGLARLAWPARVLALVLSDVIGDPLDVIASGPAAPDPTTFADAWSVIDRFRLRNKLPEAIAQRLQRGVAGLEPETPDLSDPIFERVEILVVGNNTQAVAAALAAARQRGWACLDLGSMIEGEAREVGRVLGGIARSIVAEGRPIQAPACIIAGGETVVTVTGSGRGGRNQEVALGAAFAIDGLPDTLIVSLGTDGTDGPTDAAGALADGTTFQRAMAAGLDPHRSLAENDAYPFFEALGDLLITGPTRTNVNDIMCVFVGMPGRTPSEPLA